jgi:hypothetical protein
MMIHYYFCMQQSITGQYLVKPLKIDLEMSDYLCSMKGNYVLLKFLLWVSRKKKQILYYWHILFKNWSVRIF